MDELTLRVQPPFYSDCLTLDVRSYRLSRNVYNQISYGAYGQTRTKTSHDGGSLKSLEVIFIWINEDSCKWNDERSLFYIVGDTFIWTDESIWTDEDNFIWNNEEGFICNTEDICI
jgi:hypothetical protein